ncbi:aquaporin-11 isoform X2 [Phthorimaea operculella]|nr:aquaporin-11 isoform X2 [Phthorimaea operculella]
MRNFPVINKTTFAPLLVSALFILLTSLLAHCARRLVQKVVQSEFARQLLEEAIAAAELCGCCFELIIVADNFGVGTYAVFLFALTIWWSLNWGDATACPYTHLEEIIEGKGNVRRALLKTWAELTGGILVFKYVPVLYGAVVEGIATCMCRLASKALGDLNPRFATAIDAFIGTSLVVAAFDYSGGYFNPVLATSLKAGCEGHSMLEHAVVYWIGACAGSVLSVYLYKLPAIQRFVKGGTEVNGDSIWAEKED